MLMREDAGSINGNLARQGNVSDSVWCGAPIFLTHNSLSPTYDSRSDVVSPFRKLPHISFDDDVHIYTP